MSQKYDFGLVGLGVMGRNFILNVADNGFTAFGNDLDADKVNALITEGGAIEKVNATTDIATFVAALAVPRKIMLLVPAGKIVDVVIENLLPHVEAGDIIIDGGNSFFTDTDRRAAYLSEKGIHFFGAGVSGGAKGARKGPSIMPGGSKEGYAAVQPIFEAVSAKFKGEPCVAYLGPKSAGNYVKMVHNGIEYGLMQLTAEIYDVLKKGGGLTNTEMHTVFSNWNAGRLQSFLVEITAEILAKKDDLTDGHLVDVILDKAKQKGTGKWTSQNAMDLGIPIPSIDIAVSMREISALKEERQMADKLYDRPAIETMPKQELTEVAEKALYFDIADAFQANSNLSNLLLAPSFIEKVQASVAAARTLAAYGVKNGIPLPALSNSLTYFDAYTSSRLPLNIIQGQRDYFGSHTYERVDRPGIFHTQWDNA